MATRQAQIDKVLAKFRTFLLEKFNVDVPEAQVSNDFICQRIIELKAVYGEKIRAISTLDELEEYLYDLYDIGKPQPDDKSTTRNDGPPPPITILIDCMRTDPEIFTKLLMYRNALFDLLS